MDHAVHSVSEQSFSFICLVTKSDSGQWRIKDTVMSIFALKRGLTVLLFLILLGQIEACTELLLRKSNSVGIDFRTE